MSASSGLSALLIFLTLPDITIAECFYDVVSDINCSGHGECNNETQQCECDIDYGSIDCSQQYTLYQLPKEEKFVETILTKVF